MKPDKPTKGPPVNPPGQEQKIVLIVESISVKNLTVKNLEVEGKKDAGHFNYKIGLPIPK